MGRTFRKLEKRDKPRKFKNEQKNKYSVKRKALFDMNDDDETEQFK
jgi:hypothetical protein